MYRRTGMENGLVYKIAPTALIIQPDGSYFLCVRVGTSPIDILGVRYFTESTNFNSYWSNANTYPTGGFQATPFAVDTVRGVSSGTMWHAFHSAQSAVPALGTQRTPLMTRNPTLYPLRITDGVVNHGLRLAANTDYVLRLLNEDTVARRMFVEVEFLEYGNAN